MTTAEAINAYVESIGPVHFPQLYNPIDPISSTPNTRTHVYFDHAGATLYPAPLVESALEGTLLGSLPSPTPGTPETLDTAPAGPRGFLYGNPHSDGSPSADLTAKRIESVRQQVLGYFGTDSSHYTCIFTANATAALKLVGESVHWARADEVERALRDFNAGNSAACRARPMGLCYYHMNNCHNSAVGVREVVLEAAGVDNWFGGEDVEGAGNDLGGARTRAGTEREINTSPGCMHSLGKSILEAFAGFGLKPCRSNSASIPLNRAAINVPRGRDRVGVLTLHNLVALAPPRSSPTSTPGPHTIHSPLFNILAIPLQSNLSGRRFPLALLDRLLSNITFRPPGTAHMPFHVPTLIVLDAASYLSTTPLDLTRHPAHAVAASFYKIFGFPTGVGVLVVRNDVVPLLWGRTYFGGGTVQGVVCGTPVVSDPDGEREIKPWPWTKRKGDVLMKSWSDYAFAYPHLDDAGLSWLGNPPAGIIGLHARFEDGTLNFLDVMMLERGFAYMRGVWGREFDGGGGAGQAGRQGDDVLGRAFKNVREHTRWLVRSCWHRMATLRHHDGSPVVMLVSPLCPTAAEDESRSPERGSQGAIITFCVLRPACERVRGRGEKEQDQEVVGYNEVLRKAGRANVHLRVGCFCNPGECESVLGTHAQFVRRFIGTMDNTSGGPVDTMDGWPTGLVRISLGMSNTMADVDRWIEFLEGVFCVRRDEGLRRGFEGVSWEE
ncbi:hypothetical protein M427DRAFT_27684 [Gonapodya prolifera JEL478]|uniref:PLP-dependent transferase n=1 Tax=Gonapodya prolifera (strain JEL478) TaxID=1344416 RepID=A0A139AWZ7_GONPJ|nr:hypothetical protein M427DRAFT_27684 [Gonapodya prolifera JEL478]|eukprot:KXS21271.1 hypothetical protein M427DRAFT_27684 [Gonapodya prolifera JEL478]